MVDNRIKLTPETAKDYNMFYSVEPDKEHLIVEFLSLDAMFDFIEEYNIKSHNIFINYKILDGVEKYRIRFIIKDNDLDYDYINKHYTIIKETN
jgi:hypothetical protein